MAKIELTDDQKFQRAKLFLIQFLFNDSYMDVEERIRKIEHLKQYHPKIYHCLCELDVKIDHTRENFEAVLDSWMSQRQQKNEFMIVDKGNYTLN